MTRAHLFPAILLAVLLPTAAGGYDLQEYLKLVEANSKDLELARRDIAAAQADVRAARSAVLPAVGGSVSYLRNLTPLYYYQGGQKIELAGDNNQFELGIQASQNLFNLQVFSGIRAAKEYHGLSNEFFGAQRSAIFSAAKKAFYQALLLEKVYQVRKASEDNALESYHNARSRYENGLVSQLGALQAEVAWKTKIPETTLARKNLDIAMLNLRDLAGLAEDQELKLEGDLDDYPPLPPTIGVDKVLEARADYRALLTQHRLRRIEVEAARAQAFPAVSASLQYGFSAQSDKLRLEQRNNALQFKLSLMLPVYSGGYVASQIDKAENEAARSLLSLEKKRQEVSMDLDGLSLRLREAHERILSAQATAATAEKALSIARTSRLFYIWGND